VNLLFILLVAVYTCLGFGREIIIIFTSLLIHELPHKVALMLVLKLRRSNCCPWGQARIEDFTG
jgi:stage IV sporulation protein FB